MWHERFKRKYMINLPERTDRRQSVTAELGKLGLPCEFVDGVRGKDNPFASWFFRTILKQTGNAGPGLVGCHLAHAMIWIQAALDARLLPDDYVLIMEDDLVWCNGASNELIDSLLARVPPQATMIKFSVADWNNRVHILEQLGQVKLVAEGVYLQTGMLGGTLMYAVRKAALPPLIQFNYTMPFDNSIMANTYLLIPHAEGVPNINSRNYHFGVCYQGDTFSDVYTDRPGQNKPRGAPPRLESLRMARCWSLMTRPTTSCASG